MVHIIHRYPFPNMYQGCLSCLSIFYWKCIGDYEQLEDLEEEERRRNVDHIL